MSKKGYVPNRSPGANQVAASQNKSFKGCYFYVEGASDSCMWRNFLDEKNVKIVACNGWEKVVDSVTKNLDAGNTCIGIVDLDFHTYIPEQKKVHSNIFLTDDHDLEMMIYHSGDYLKAINQVDPFGKRQEYEHANDVQVLDEAKAIVGRIARLRITVKKHDLKLVFRKMNKNKDFSYPDYDKALDKHALNYVSDEKLVTYMIGWSRNETNAQVLPTEVLPLLEQENTNDYDEWKFLNGHDMTLVLTLLLKKKIKLSALVNAESLEKSLYVAYEKQSLQRTALYANIQQFAEQNNLVIFK